MSRGRKIIEFDGFRADLGNRLLYRGGRPVSLTPKAFETLAVLLERAGEVLGKDELLDRVWPGAFVEEATLTQNIYTLRKALAEAGGEPGYIETVPRRGYRFTVPVREEAAPQAPAGVPAVASLAVLPFEALAGSLDDPFLGLGLADAVITRLSNLRQLRVRPTSAVRRWVGLERDPLAAGRALQVDAVLDGTLQREGSGIRLTVQLIGTGDGSPVWAARFDAIATSLFELEDSLSQRLAEELRLHLSPAERDRLAHRSTRDPRAYQAYLRGRYFWNRRDAEALQKALGCFREALAADERYAPAFAGLADCYVLLPLYGDVPPHAAFPQALAAAERALALDDGLAEAHTSLAYSRFFYAWDWAGAEAGFCRALELNAGYSTAHHWYAFLLSALGRHAEAVARARRALESDPLSLVINADLGLVLYFGREDGEAIDQFRRTVELDPAFAYARFGLGHACQLAGRLEEAVEQFRRAVELAPSSAFPRAALGQGLAAAGRVEEARAVLEDLRARAAERPVEASNFAFVYAALGEADEAIAWLDRACDERSRFVVFLNTWPIYDRLRGHPRWPALIRRVGLPGA